MDAFHAHGCVQRRRAIRRRQRLQRTQSIFSLSAFSLFSASHDPLFLRSSTLSKVLTLVCCSFSEITLREVLGSRPPRAFRNMERAEREQLYWALKAQTTAQRGQDLLREQALPVRFGPNRGQTEQPRRGRRARVLSSEQRRERLTQGQSSMDLGGGQVRSISSSAVSRHVCLRRHKDRVLRAIHLLVCSPRSHPVLRSFPCLPVLCSLPSLQVLLRHRSLPALQSPLSLSLLSACHSLPPPRHLSALRRPPSLTVLLISLPSQPVLLSRPPSRPLFVLSPPLPLRVLSLFCIPPPCKKHMISLSPHTRASILYLPVLHLPSLLGLQFL